WCGRARAAGGEQLGEPPGRSLEPGCEIVREAFDPRAQLGQAKLEPALVVADMGAEVVGDRERGAARRARHVIGCWERDGHTDLSAHRALRYTNHRQIPR